MTTETEKDWPFPWHKSKGIYDSDGPKKPTRVQIDQVWYFVSPTGDDGIDTNRARQFVACLTCDEILHHNTTGPSSRILSHHRAEHMAVAIPKFVERVSRVITRKELMELPTPTEKERNHFQSKELWRLWIPEEGWRILWWENDPDKANKRLIAWAWVVDGYGDRWMEEEPQAELELQRCTLRRLIDGQVCGVLIRKVDGHNVESDGKRHWHSTGNQDVDDVAALEAAKLRAVGRKVKIVVSTDGKSIQILDDGPDESAPPLEPCKSGIWDDPLILCGVPIRKIKGTVFEADGEPHTCRSHTLEEEERGDMPAVGDTVEVHFDSDGEDVGICPVVATAACNFCVCIGEGKFPTEGNIDGDELMTLWPSQINEKWYQVQPGPQPMRKKPLTDHQREVYDAAVKRVVEAADGPQPDLLGVGVDDGEDLTGSWRRLQSGELFAVVAADGGGDLWELSNAELDPVYITRRKLHEDYERVIKNISFLMRFSMGPPRIVHMRALVAVADRMQISTEADFNGVTVLACPGDDPESLDKNLEAALEQKEKFATADRKRN